MLIGKTHSPLLAKISKCKLKNFIGSTVAFSFLMNIGHCFQYRINYGLNIDLTLNDYEYLAPLDTYPFAVFQNSSFDIYTLVYFLINFAVFFVVNTWVEVSIVRKLRHEIAEKRASTEQEMLHINGNNSAHSDVVNRMLRDKQRRIEQDARKEQRAIKMVVVNSLLNFFLRSPEILVFISDYTSLFQRAFFFLTMFNLNNLMLSISCFAYTLTFTTNVVIYYVFNDKFKKSFSF
jgi:hypothetical protein